MAIQVEIFEKNQIPMKLDINKELTKLVLESMPLKDIVGLSGVLEKFAGKEVCFLDGSFVTYWHYRYCVYIQKKIKDEKRI